MFCRPSRVEQGRHGETGCECYLRRNWIGSTQRKSSGAKVGEEAEALPSEGLWRYSEERRFRRKAAEQLSTASLRSRNREELCSTSRMQVGSVETLLLLPDTGTLPRQLLVECCRPCTIGQDTRQGNGDCIRQIDGACC